MPSRKLRITVFAIILFSLSGCTRFFYNHADWAISWYVGGYIDFTRPQKKVFNEFVDKQLRWHRKQELPQYSDFLETLQKELESPMSQRQAEILVDRALDLWQAITIKAMPEMNTILLQLSDAQVDEFLNNLTKEQKKLEYDYNKRSDKKNQQLRAKNMRKGLERLSGKLHDNQLKLIDQWSKDTSGIFTSTIAQRKSWQQEVNKTFKEHRKDPQRFSKEAYQLFVYPDSYWSTEYKQLVEKNRQITFQLFSDIQQSLTEKQKKKANKTIKSYLKDLRILQES